MPEPDTLPLPAPPPATPDTWREGAPAAEPMPMDHRGPFGGTAAPADSAARVTVLPRAAGEDGAAPLPRFTLTELLGRGGMGEVEAVVDNDIGRVVAIKRRRAGLMDREGLDRFADEVRTIGRLEHPNIVPVHDVGLDELGRHYFVMKHVDGETLYAILERLRAGDPEAHRRFGFQERVRVFRGIVEAVAFAHERGVLHRDLKPANLMVGRHGEVTVLDWGLARPIDPAAPEPAHVAAAGSGGSDRISDTRRGQVLGTPAYMSPEQARGEPLDARSDVYALCVILHEWLGLKHYLADCTGAEAILAGAIEREVPLHALERHPAQPPVPMDLLWYIRAGVAKDPARRYPSVRAMLDRLDARAEGRIPVQCPVTLSQRIGQELSLLAARHPLATVILWSILPVAVLIAVAVILVR